MGFLSGIGKLVSKVTNFADKALSFIKAPLDFIMKPLQGALEKVADKLPFGLGKVVKPFIGQFLSSAAGWLAGGPLGGFFSMLPKIADTAEKINGVLHTIDGVLNGGLGGLPEQALENVTEGTAWTQAQSLLQ